MEVARAGSDVLWDRVVGREVDAGEVYEDEVSAFGEGVLDLR